jgi:hypothetical protein
MIVTPKSPIALLIAFINKSGITCYPNVPGSVSSGRFERFCTVERTGGSTEIHGTFEFDKPSIAVQCFEESLEKADLLAGEIRMLLKRFEDTDEITSVEITDTYDFTNPQDKRPRYQVIATIGVTNYWKGQ